MVYGLGFRVYDFRVLGFKLLRLDFIVYSLWIKV
jgi:hypothetical protein